MSCKSRSVLRSWTHSFLSGSGFCYMNVLVPFSCYLFFIYSLTDRRVVLSTGLHFAPFRFGIVRSSRLRLPAKCFRYLWNLLAVTGTAGSRCQLFAFGERWCSLNERNFWALNYCLECHANVKVTSQYTPHVLRWSIWSTDSLLQQYPTDDFRTWSSAHSKLSYWSS